MIEMEKTGPHKLRKLYAQNFMSTGLDYRVHNHSFQNLRRGLLERVFYVEDKEKGGLKACPQPYQGAFKELAYLRRRFVMYCKNHTRISTNDFVDCYHGRKRTIYQNAADSLLDRPLDRKDAALKTFIKAEKFCINAKPDPAPRVIQPRSPRYNTELGRYLKKYEHDAYRALDKIWGGVTVMKGYSVEQVGQHIASAWNQFQIPVAVGFDMSRFDQHVSVPALDFEHSCYLGSFKYDRQLQQLLSWQKRNFGVAFADNGMIRYKKDGCRMSGDMNTALGNCLLACLITRHLMGRLNCRLVNNGDDCVLFCESTDLPHVVSNLTTGWRKFGFTCIAEEPVYTLEHVRFCQMAPVFDGESYVMVRDPKVSISKDSFSLVHWNNEKNAKQWMKAVGQCGEKITGGIPIVQDFYKKYQDIAGDVRDAKNVEATAAGIYMMSHFSRRAYREPTQEARYSFYLAFNILPDEQVAIEANIRQLEWSTEFGPGGDLADRVLQWTFNNQL